MKQSKLKKIAKTSYDKIINVEKSNNLFQHPFTHFYIDDFFEPEFADNLFNAFPSTNSKSWEVSNDTDIEVKMRSKWESEFDIPKYIVDAVRIMNSSYFLNSLSKILKIPKLIPDPYFTGGGLNMTVSGGLLDVHVDGNYHDASGLNRRVNVILYLNPNWEKSWGGEFGLYDNNGENLVKKISPIHNRLLAFDTNDYSFHGLPEPLRFPNGLGRKSIILYYYTKAERPNSKISVNRPHSALWKKRGWLDKSGNKTREFQ